MLFTSWMALCGWNRLISSLLRAIYSTLAIPFEPHARLLSFLPGSSHQALCVSLRCHAMPAPVGPSQHIPCAPPDAAHWQHDLYPNTKLPQGWRSFDLHSWLLVWCCLDLAPTISVEDNELFVVPARLPPPHSQVLAVRGLLSLTSPAHMGWRATSEEPWQ